MPGQRCVFVIPILTLLSFVAMLVAPASVWAHELGPGQVLRLHLGMSQAEVNKTLGTPDRKSDTRWIYETSGEGTLQLSWKSSRLQSAEARFVPSLPHPERVIPEEARLSKLRIEQSPTDIPKDLLVGDPRTGHVFELNPVGRLATIRLMRPWKETSPTHTLKEIIEGSRKPRAQRKQGSGK